MKQMSFEFGLLWKIGSKLGQYKEITKNTYWNAYQSHTNYENYAVAIELMLMFPYPVDIHIT